MRCLTTGSGEKRRPNSPASSLGGSALCDALLLGAHLGVVHSRRGVAQHQRAGAIGIGCGKAQHRPSAHRLAHQRGPLDSQMVKQRAQVRDERAGARTAGSFARMAEAAMVEGDALMGPGQHRNLLPPAQMAAAAAVGEHNRGSLAVRFVVEIDPVDLCRWHRGPPLKPPAHPPASLLRVSVLGVVKRGARFSANALTPSLISGSVYIQAVVSSASRSTVSRSLLRCSYSMRRDCAILIAEQLCAMSRASSLARAINWSSGTTSRR